LRNRSATRGWRDLARRPGAWFLAPACLGTLLLAVPAGADRETAPETKDIYGFVESVLVGESRLEMKAKLDTGAATSSLDADDIRHYTRDGRGWVEFTVRDQRGSRTVTFRKPLVRRVSIKEHDGSRQRRPVVAVEICLGSHLREIEVSLVDRTQFLYPVLLGRRALEGIALVDPELSLTSRPDCGAGG